AELARPVARKPSWTDLVSWWPPCGETATWTPARMRHQLADMAGDPATARVIPHGAGPAEVSTLTDLRRSGDVHRHLRALGAPLGLAVHAPFLDTGVIQAGLGVP